MQESATPEPETDTRLPKNDERIRPTLEALGDPIEEAGGAEQEEETTAEGES